MEIQKTRLKQRNQIHCPFSQVDAGIVQASSRASVQYHVSSARELYKNAWFHRL